MPLEALATRVADNETKGLQKTANLILKIATAATNTP